MLRKPGRSWYDSTRTQRCGECVDLLPGMKVAQDTTDDDKSCFLDWSVARARVMMLHPIAFTFDMNIVTQAFSSTCMSARIWRLTPALSTPPYPTSSSRALPIAPSLQIGQSWGN